MEIRISGFGGQGVILAGHIIGRAVAVHERKNVTMTQSFGPEARGGACSAQLVISDEKILYPYVTKTDVFVAMSQEGYQRFYNELKDDGLLLIEEDLVKLEPAPKTKKIFKIPATRLAEELGRRIVLNIVMVGFITAVSKVVGYDSVKKAILETVPKGTEELNLKAFEKGYEYGINQLSKSQT